MALTMTTGEIPKDAIVLTRGQAVNYQWTQILEWPNSSEVWPFKWGLIGLASMSGLCGAEINRLFRKKLKLRNYGLFSSNLPLTLAPAMISVALHSQVITNDLFLKQTKCPLCLQYKAALIQTGMGVVYPVVMSPIASFLLATRHATYRVPYYTDVRGTLALWWKLTKPMGNTLFAMFVVQSLAAAALTYYEAECLYKLQTKLLTEGRPIDESEFVEIN